jgi:ring-1,2-phenylacetyl-CoA epoxidase subunit PaaE
VDVSLQHEFVPLTVVEVRRETPSAISVSFAIPEALREAFAFRPGQHLNLRTRLGGEEVRRSYSICSGPGEPYLRIAIKRVPGGVFSEWASEALAAGAPLDVMPPQGRFALAAADGLPRHILGLAAGAGITPIISMAAHALALEPATRFTLVYGNRTVDEIMFREVLEDLKDRHLDRFTLVHVLSREKSEDGALFEGRITADVLSRLADRLIPIREISHAYLCGPGGMIRELRNALFALGMPRDRVHHEFFAPGGGAYRTAPEAGETGSTPERPSDAAPRASTVEAILDGTRHRFDTAPGETVMEAGLRAGLRIPYACKAGMCCTCRAHIVEGGATMRTNYSLEPWEQAQGFTLTCQAIPTSARLVVDYDRM